MLRILTVSELTNYIKSKLEGDSTLRGMWVKGEISNFKHHTSGHMYFTLKDHGSALRAVMFKGRNRLLQFRPDNGMGVMAMGYISLFERDGQYQLYVDDMQPDGIGALHLAYVQLKEKLEREGLFDVGRKRRLPLIPRKVGVVTSPTGAAVRDIITVLRRRFPQSQVIIVPVAVQGEEAPGQIARGIEVINGIQEVDVVIVGRGGGSIEELWAFNSEIVARSIYASKIPVISAVGHETDFTIADFVADHRAATPSAAAELAVPDCKELLRYICGIQERLNNAVTGKVSSERKRLKGLLQRNVFIRPKERIFRLAQELDYFCRELHQAADKRKQKWKHDLSLHLARLHALSPLATMARGYSISRTLPEGKVVSRIDQVTTGQNILVTLSDGSIKCSVLQKEEKGFGVDI